MHCKHRLKLTWRKENQTEEAHTWFISSSLHISITSFLVLRVKQVLGEKIKKQYNCCKRKIKLEVLTNSHWFFFLPDFLSSKIGCGTLYYFKCGSRAVSGLFLRTSILHPTDHFAKELLPILENLSLLEHWVYFFGAVFTQNICHSVLESFSVYFWLF